MSSTTPVVFVVEDDEHIRNALSRLLRSGGYSMNVYGSASAFQNGADLTFLTLIKRGHVTRVVVTTATPLSANIQHVCEEEKNRTARELHDDLGQPLAALKLEVSRIDNRAEAAMTALAGADLHTVSTLIDQLVVSVRRIAADLRPAMLDDLSLAPAVEQFSDQFSALYGVRVIREVDADDIDLQPETATVVFRVVQEAMSNVARHLGATEVMLKLCGTDRTVS